MKAKEVVVRYRKSGKKFEILIDWNKFKEYKEGKLEDIRDVVIGDGLFSDIRAATRAKDEEIHLVFGNKKIEEIYKIILNNGEIQLTEDQRKEIRVEKRRKIISFLNANAIDARTNMPFPPKRIELALEQVGFKVDVFESTEMQIEKAIKALKPVIPIKIERKFFRLRVPLEYAAVLRNKLLKIAEIKSEDWGDTYVAHVDIPGGLMSELIDTVNKITHGSGLLEEINQKNR